MRTLIYIEYKSTFYILLYMKGIGNDMRIPLHMTLAVACAMYGLLRLAMTVLAICYTMIIPFLPIYLLELGVPKDDVALWSGLVFGITFLIAGIMAPIWGKIADNKGKKRMALRAGFAIAICYVLIGMVSRPI